MTTLVAALGLLPTISNGIGAQTQKPLAIVVIGGALMLARGGLRPTGSKPRSFWRCLSRIALARFGSKLTRRWKLCSTSALRTS